MADADTLALHCRFVAARLLDGGVIPFLGAGANLCGRPPEADWLRDGYLPSGSELAAHLAAFCGYPEDARDLVRISQYLELAGGDAVLVEKLHEIFAGAYQPNELHRLLAELPGMLRAKERPEQGQLVMTTNYDDALERAFAEAGEPFDLVYYAAEPNEPGRFVHVRPDGERVPIPKHTDYRGFALEERSVILKVHGAVDRQDAFGDSYVITEDDYIEYLARENVSKLIPAYLMARMRRSHFLFLGYAMRDWNLRVILYSIWLEQKLRYTSWAIQLDPSEIDKKLWGRHDVEIVSAALEDWVEAMRAKLAAA